MKTVIGFQKDDGVFVTMKPKVVLCSLLLTLGAFLGGQARSEQSTERQVWQTPTPPTRNMIKGRNNEERWKWVEKHVRELATAKKEAALKILGIEESALQNESYYCAITDNLSSYPDEYSCYVLCVKFSGYEVRAVSIGQNTCVLKKAI